MTIDVMGTVVSLRQKEEVAKESEFTVRYYISSKEIGTKELLNATRSHWLVEYMHWSLETVFGEDTSRKRAEAGQDHETPYGTRVR